MNKEEFINELEKINIIPTDEMLEKLELFYQLLIEWNEKINLTTITNREEVYLKHFYDSLTLSKCFDLTKDISLCDVGSGAGFPGIVLKIFFPNLNITLIDSLQKRVNYLNHIIEKLELTNIRAIHTRMEEYSRIHEEEFDIITARAVANLNTLLEISIKALKVNGYMIFMKANAYEELQNSKMAQEKLGCKLINVDKFVLPKENSNRTLITFEKEQKTSKMYPRSIDKIKKHPL